MALVIKDRVKETTTTTGTGTFTLAGAVSGFETFTANLSNSDTTYYVCTDNTDFEVGLGTFTSSGTTLSRDTILASSNSNNKVNWSSGTRTIFMTYPADKAVFKDASNNINGTFVGNITGDVTGNADTATTLETARTINGTSFNGGANITVTAAAGTLTGSTLNSGVTASSLTSLGTLASNLNLGGQDIVTTTSNQDIDLAAHGTGKVVIKGNTNQGAIKLNCEANSHGQTIIAAPHSEAASNTLTLPSTGGDARLVSATSTATLTNKTLTSPKINEDVAVTATATELNILDGVTSSTAELNILDGVTATASELNILDGKSFVDEDNMASDSATAIASQQSIKAYVDAQKADMQFVLEDGDGTEVQITKDKEVKFVEGGGLDINWTDTSTGSDGDPYDLTFTVNASQTGITSLTNASLVIGRDADNDIDFSTDNQITFRANGADQIKLSDGALAPVTDNDIDLGTSSLEFKNAFFDGTVTADAFSGPLTGNVTGNADTASAVAADNISTGDAAVTIATSSGNITIDAQANNSDIIFKGTDGGVDITALTLDMSASGNAKFNNNVNLESDSSIIHFGTDKDVKLTHVHDTGLLLNSSMQLQFGDSGTYIHQSADGVLDLVSDTEIEINATTIDMNGNLDVSGSLTLGGTAITSTATELNILDGVTASAADINLIDGITNGTVIASKAIITDSNKDISGGRNITISGELDAATLDISGNADIDGTLEADAITVNGTALNTVIADEATALAIALG